MVIRQVFESLGNRLGRASGVVLTLFFASLVLSACSTATDQLTGGAPQPPANEPVWNSADIGGSELGTSTISSDLIQLQGVGDIGDNSDAFHFIYQEASGIVGIAAQLVEHGATLPSIWPKAGITIRDGLEPGATNVTVYAINNDQFRGLVVQRRSSTGSRTEVISSRSQITAPLWLRILREGATVRVDVSSDGANWEPITSTQVAFTASVFLGLAVASGTAEPIEASFRDVAIVDGATGGTRPPTANPVPSPTPTPTPTPTPNPTPSPVPNPEPVPSPEPMPNPNPGPTTEATYQVDSTTDFLNPERGFYVDVDLLRGNFSNIRNSGYTMVRSTVRLDDYRNSAIPSSLLSNIRSGLEQLRSAGLKISLRFAYNASAAPDAPLNIVLQHIDQVAPILNEYEDVIAVLQAGFIGAWGEWHGSTNGLATAGNKRIIANALLEALPDSRQIQVRSPYHRRDILGPPDPLEERFVNTPEARIGFLNDCFLAGSDDGGTYGGDQVRDRGEIAEFSKYTVTGGETCSMGFPHARQACANSISELKAHNWDYLNSGFYSGVLNNWRSEGCYDEISRGLGYRLALLSGSVTTQVQPGGVLTVTTVMRNDGFGKVYNPRPIDIVLRNVTTGESRTIRAVSDARAMFPLGGEVRTIQLSVNLPAELAQGDYEVSLRLPDASASLASDPRYSVRFANNGLWDATAGLNRLNLTTSIRN